jgi:ankyrin repeat protein
MASALTKLPNLHLAIAPTGLPLAIAIEKSDAEMVQLLLKFNSSVEAKLVGPSTLLGVAIKKGNAKIVHLILEGGADLERPTDSLLHLDAGTISAFANILVMAGILSLMFGQRWVVLALGAFVFAVLILAMFLNSKEFPLTRTPLSLAIKRNDLAIANVLIEFGANCKKILHFWSPLQYARYWGSEEIVHSLKSACNENKEIQFSRYQRDEQTL